jgi:hypothetical protein
MSAPEPKPTRIGLSNAAPQRAVQNSLPPGQRCPGQSGEKPGERVNLALWAPARDASINAAGAAFDQPLCTIEALPVIGRIERPKIGSDERLPETHPFGRQERTFGRCILCCWLGESVIMQGVIASPSRPIRTIASPSKPPSQMNRLKRPPKTPDRAYALVKNQEYAYAYDWEYRPG